MATIIPVASGKGGVGKSTIAACLSAALATKGHTVLLVDGDMGLRDLDLMIGVQDNVLFTSADLCQKDCFKEDAVISLTKTLDFLPASQSLGWEDVGRKRFTRMLKRLTESYDYIIVDLPAGIGRGWDIILQEAHKVLLVVEPNRISIRDVQKVMSHLHEKRFFDYGIVINAYPILSEERLLSIGETLDYIGAETLVSVLPMSQTIRRLANEGMLLTEPWETMYDNLLQRIVSYVEGEDTLDVLQIEKLFLDFAQQKKRAQEDSQHKGVAQRISSMWKWKGRRSFR